MLIQISAFIAAIAFAVLVVYLIKTLRSAQSSLDQATATLADIQRTIDAVSSDVKDVVATANEMTSNIHVQVKKLEPVVDSVENVGEALEEITSVLKSVSVGVANGVRRAAKRFEKPVASENHGAAAQDNAPSTNVPVSNVPVSVEHEQQVPAAHQVQPTPQAQASQPIHIDQDEQHAVHEHSERQEHFEYHEEQGQQGQLPIWETAMAEAAAAHEGGSVSAQKTNNTEQWKLWVDLGVQAWQLFRKS